MKKHFIIAGILLFLYVIIINVFNVLASYSISFQNQVNQEQIIIDPTIETAHVGDSLTVSVSRKRWYGKIYEAINNNGKISNLYFLGFIKLPLVNLGISYLAFHILFFIALLIYISLAATIRLIKYKNYGSYYGYM